MSSITLPLPLAVTAAAEAMALAAKVHPGPYRRGSDWVNECGLQALIIEAGPEGDDALAMATVWGTGEGDTDTEAVADFFAASRTLVPRLAALATALAERLEAIDAAIVRSGITRVLNGESVVNFEHELARLRAPLVIGEGQ